MSERQAAVAQLLREAGEAHHKAFSSKGGEDPGWPAWYAHWLMRRMPEHFTMDEAELAAVLEALDGEHKNTPDAAPWPEFYAAQLIERFG